MWPFKNKVEAVKKLPKITKNISYRTSRAKVGRTYVEVDLEDGRSFTTIIYGEPNQWTCNGRGLRDPESDPAVSDVVVTSSLSKARYFLSSLRGDSITLLDDPNDTEESIVGKPIGARIEGTEEDYSIEFQEAFLEDL